MKTEHRIMGEPIYSVLQELFEDADAYVERPELRSGAGDPTTSNYAPALYGHDED